MKRFFAFVLLLSRFAEAQDIIPQPVSVKKTSGSFTLSAKTVIAVADDEDKKAANFFNDYLQQFYGFKLDIDKKEGKDYIRLVTRTFIKVPDKETYNLSVTPGGVTIEGDTHASTFYGIQSLIQLLPIPASKTSTLSIPFVTIIDYPRFAYRGMHLDVGRHFFPVSFIKKYIDYIALHKMNYFHWHLTEDQGWRIELKQYPKLNSVGSYRNGTIVGRYPGTRNDNTPYAGYYTQDEVKDIVQYAADRYITVIPEIEMPGHSSAAIAAYPWLSCFPEKPTKIPANPSKESLLQQSKGQKKLVQETWGVFEDVYCAGNDSTFAFLENILNEVMPLFPAQYIHIGGDECPKNHWKKCPKCQERIKKEGLKDEKELQSYFIQRIEKYVNSKGKTIIGWDEILEGGLAPNAVVMSWRGERFGIEAAKQKHYVIMTPEPYAYLNFSQTRYEDSVTIGRYTPVDKVYNYEPVAAGLDSAQSSYILGVQGNVWTEYMKHPTTVEYNIFPRMSAMSEVAWTPKEKKNWNDFERRLPSQIKRLELWKAHYSNAYFNITPTVLPTKNYNGVYWKLETKNSKGKLSYRIGNKTAPYNSPVLITKPAVASAQLSVNGKTIHQVTQSFEYNKATGKKVTLTKQPMGAYSGQGEFSLVNGIYSRKGLSFPDWLGWGGGADIEAVIDFGKAESFSSVKFHTLDQTPSSIYLPEHVEVFVSNDGKSFKSVGKGNEFARDTLLLSGFITVSFPKQSARFIKLYAKSYGLIPEGSPGAGTRALIFTDEIQVY